jgi:hypothetical protein
VAAAQHPFDGIADIGAGAQPDLVGAQADIPRNRQLAALGPGSDWHDDEGQESRGDEDNREQQTANHRPRL